MKYPQQLADYGAVTMNLYYLATKVQIPPQPRRAVPRPRLIDAIERAIPDYKLLWLTAPAGYGKTTLLSQWAHKSRFSVAWFSLTEEDNDFERFFRYLLSAWEEVQPGIKESPVGLLLGAAWPEKEAVLAAFINVANEIPGHTVFVLDDCHLIEEPSIHQALTFLFDHLPPTLHFVLASRAEPPLPLARYRARHELLELRADDLNFSQQESENFLNEVMGLDLAGEEVVRLQEQLEGWIAGLQLVALSLQRHQAGTNKLAVSGRHRFIADYLSEDVLAHLPGNVRHFLLQTGILDSLCESLCDAVTGEPGGQAMLETLERDNLFLVPLDDNRQWFRYHRLFADFLREGLNRHHPDMVAELHCRAARWYLAHDMPDEALQHAVAGEAAEIAMQIFDAYISVKLNTGEFAVVKRWVEGLPEKWHTAYPILGLAQAGLFAFTGSLDACLRCINEIEQRLQPVMGEQDRRHLAKATAIRCAMACMQEDVKQAESYAGLALNDLTSEDHSFLHMVYGALGDVYRRKGRWEEARQSYLSVLDLPKGPTYPIHSVHVYGALADLELHQGGLRAAAMYWRKALAGIEDPATWGGIPLPLIGWVYIRLGEILYEWNELKQAGDYLAGGLERAELGGDVQAMIAGYLLAGRLKLTAGDSAAADDYLERVRPLLENASFPDWVGRFERFQLELWLAQDRLRSAVNWADEHLRSVSPGGVPEGEGALEEGRRLTLARVLIVKGDSPAIDRALGLLKHLLLAADAEGRTGIQIEALALQALAQWRRGDIMNAMTALERSLHLAEAEGYIRLFADLGLPMARLLQEARDRAVMPEYVKKLLGAFGPLPSLSTSTKTPLPEPLGPREQEVLKLIAAGLTNREIAEALVISPETVKKHTGNIFAKLAVSNRTEAAARARELDLLD